MKKLFILLCATCLAATAQSQLSNGVALHLIPAAATPLTGNELVPMSQITSGTNATKTATVNQINVAPMNFAQSATAALTNLALANIAADLAISNLVNTATSQGNGNVTSIALGVTKANAQLVALNIVSNEANATVTALNSVSNSATAATTAITTLQGATNGLQGQITTIASQLGLGATNGGTGNFSRLLLPSVNLGTFATPVNGATNNLDFSAGSTQTINVGVPNTSVPLLFLPMNFKDGDNVFLYVTVTNGIPGYVGTTLTATNGTVDIYTSGLRATGNAQSIQINGATKEAVLNWTVIGTKIIFTATAHF